MHIRYAMPEDIPGMIRLLQQVGEVHHSIRPDLFRSGAQKYDEAALDALLCDLARPVFIAEEQETVVGYCFCMVQEIENDPVLCDRKVLYIDDLCVEESCRGQGIAAKLYQHTCEFAKAIACHAVTLNVWCGNDGAMRFYEKMGMKPQKIGMETILEDGAC